jgi:hypothetical protein
VNEGEACPEDCSCDVNLGRTHIFGGSFGLLKSITTSEKSFIERSLFLGDSFLEIILEIVFPLEGGIIPPAPERVLTIEMM